MRFKLIKKEEREKIPKSSGVYSFKKGREILYIGKAVNLRERIKNHFQQPGYRDYLFLDKVEKIGYIKTNSEIEALILEANLIKKYQPKYNVLWKDDKNYFFVGITKEDFPRVFWTHQTKFKIQNSKFKIQYIGPFVDGKALKQTLKVLRKVFPFRSCRVIPNRPCLWYHLNRCPAPCLLRSKLIKEIPPDSLKLKKISQRNTKNLIKVFKEGKKAVLKDLKKEMKLAAKNQDFEGAAKIRDQMRCLEKVLSNAQVFSFPKENGLSLPGQSFYNKWRGIEKKLKKILGLERKISRLEAYDISNIQGQQATGSMVTFINGRREKNFYRRFKIKLAKKPNDLAMIKECLTRRFNHREWGFPDLILIDGGKAQLNTARETINQLAWSAPDLRKPKVIALAKKRNELFIEREKNPILLKTLPREIFSLILQLRDEAHRFAISYHRKLRERSLRT